MILAPVCPSCSSPDPRYALVKGRSLFGAMQVYRAAGLYGTSKCADLWHDQMRLLQRIVETGPKPSNVEALGQEVVKNNSQGFGTFRFANKIGRRTRADIFGGLDATPIERFIQWLFDDIQRVALVGPGAVRESLSYMLAKESQRRRPGTGVRSIPTVISEDQYRSPGFKLPATTTEFGVWDIGMITSSTLALLPPLGYVTLYGQKAEWDPTEQMAAQVIQGMEEAWDSL